MLMVKLVVKISGEIRGQFLLEKCYIYDVVIQRLYYCTTALLKDTTAVCFREVRGFLCFVFFLSCKKDLFAFGVIEKLQITKLLIL